MNINRYMLTTYRHHARGPDAFDCYGLVRHVLHYEIGQPLLPSFSHVDPDNKLSLTRAWYEAEAFFSLSESPRAGSMACFFKGRLLLHVGVVVMADKGLSVLETTPEHGPRIIPVRTLGNYYKDVLFYDQILP